MAIKKQLAAYYDAQGLTGKHRRKAMQYDMKAVRANAIAHRGHVVLHSLHTAFIFDRSPEGHTYWAHRAYDWH